MADLDMQLSPRMRSAARLVGWLVFLFIVALLVILSVALVIRSDLFNPDQDFSDANVSAIWAFVGAAFAAAVALVGAAFTASYNQQAESRQRHEAATGALSLLNVESKGGPTWAQITGVVLTLRGLGFTETARGILASAIYAKALDAPSEAALISPFLGESASGDDGLEVSRMLRNSAQSWTARDGSYEWPISIRDQWPSHLVQPARINVLVAIGSILRSRPTSWWKGKRDPFVCLLYEAMSEDGDNSVQDSAYWLLKPVLKSFEGSGIVSVRCARAFRDYEPADEDPADGESYLSTKLEFLNEKHREYSLSYLWDSEVKKMSDELESVWFK